MRQTVNVRVSSLLTFLLTSTEKMSCMRDPPPLSLESGVRKEASLESLFLDSVISEGGGDGGGMFSWEETEVAREGETGVKESDWEIDSNEREPSVSRRCR